MDIKFTLLLCILYTITSQLKAERVVKISQGLLNGTRFESRKGRNITAFIGIPYAQTPVEELRFKSPLPAKTWDGVRLANKEANFCPQDYNGKIIGDEDCLYLNVFTPVLEFNSTTGNDNLLPVMVFVHGGSFMKESTDLSDYSPKFFMDKDIVFVSMNYRLGILGFLTTGDLVSPGNYGLKDQVLALKWVQKNIRAFGGDPNRVTLFGNSAGAAAVNLIALSDATNGLFNQYIIQSGTVMGTSMYRSRTQFKEAINYIAKFMDCPTINSTAFVKCLRNISSYELMKAMQSVNDVFPQLTWVPTDELESKDAFLTDAPLNLLAQNKIKDLPFMTGTVTNEGLIGTSHYYANLTSEVITPELLENYINNTSKGYYLSSNIKRFRQMIKEYYFNESIIFEDRDMLLENLTIFLSDSIFFYPQVILLEKMVKYVKSPIYFYSFGYRGSSTLFSIETNITENFGVNHGDELIYLFPMSNTVTPTKTDKYVTDLMVDLWTSFAINGKPSSDELDAPDIWIPYNEKGNFLQIGDIKNNTDPYVTIEQEYYVDRMNFWIENFPLVQLYDRNIV